jgi:hypothetical protein
MHLTPKQATMQEGPGDKARPLPAKAMYTSGLIKPTTPNRTMMKPTITFTSFT